MIHNLMMKVKEFLQISVLYLASIQSINSELQDMIKSVYLRAQELEEIINKLQILIANQSETIIKQEVLITNQSNIIEEQKEQISNLMGRYTIDVFVIIEKFNIGPDLHSYTKFPGIRDKNFNLIPSFLLEEFGSITISHLFRKRLMPTY